MSTVFDFDINGDIVGLYSDDVDLHAVGRIVSAGDASRISFNTETQKWDVKLSGTEKVLASFHLRSNAVIWEKANLSPGGQYWPDVLKTLEANTV